MKALPFFLLCHLISGVFAQPSLPQPDDKKKVVQTMSIDAPVTIDGQMTESFWLTRASVSDFIQLEPKRGASVNFSTEVKTAHDKNYLYFAIVAHDSVTRRRYRAPDLRRDFAYQDHDLVGITIDGFNDGRNSVTFFVNAYGAQRDYLSFDDTYFDVDWNGLWKVKTTRTDSLWIAEFAIPWKTLRYKFDDNDDPRFGINFQRVRRSSNERSAWAPFPRGVGFNRMEYAGVISGFQPPASKVNVQINPYTLVSKYSDQGLTSKSGGELKWVATPQTVVDLTFNTDFAQADVDQRVNNITRFSVLFPEKRQFFLENASLFGVGISDDQANNGNISLLPFFSRRIGLDASNRPIPIEYGSRIVYRSNKRSFGGMFMQQSRNDTNPRVRHFVGRYSENVGKYNRIGMVVTSRMEDGTDTTKFKQDHTTAIDALIRLDPSNSLNLMFALTKAPELHNADDIGGYLKYQLTTRQANAWMTAAIIGKDFNPQSGFISRHDVFAFAQGVQLNLREKWLPYKKVLRDFVPEVSGEVYYQASTTIKLEQRLRITPISYNFISGGQVSLSYLINHQNIMSDFRPLGIEIAAAAYQFKRVAANLSSDGSKMASYKLACEFGPYFNGQLTNVDVSVTLAPNPHFKIQAMLNRNTFRNVGVERTDKAVDLYNINARLAVNPRLQLDLNYQKNTNDNASFYNARLSWEYMPLSFLYVVYTSRKVQSVEDSMEQNALMKLSFLKQF